MHLRGHCACRSRPKHICTIIYVARTLLNIYIYIYVRTKNSVLKKTHVAIRLVCVYNIAHDETKYSLVVLSYEEVRGIARLLCTVLYTHRKMKRYYTRLVQSTREIERRRECLYRMRVYSVCSCAIYGRDEKRCWDNR